MNVALYLVLLFYAVQSLPVNYSTKRPKENESGIPTKKTCQRENCYFSVIRTNKFEKLPRPEKSIVSTECSTDIDKIGSYYDYALNPSTGENNAASLILCRGAGICDQDFSKPEVKARWKDVLICKHHVDELLVKWANAHTRNLLGKHIYRRQNKNACSMPDGLIDVHAGQRTNIFHHHLTVQEADLLMKEKGILVHPGIPVCRLHENYLNDLKTSTETNTGRRKSVVNYEEEDIEESESCNQDDPEYFCEESLNQSPAMSSLQKFAEAAGIDLSCFSRKPYSELQERSRQKKAVRVRKLVDVMIDVIAPNDKEEFSTRVFKKQLARIASNDDEKLDKILKQVSDHYLAAFDRRSRMTVLSQVADVLPYSSVVNRYVYGEARKFARRNVDSEEPVKKLERYNRTAVENFIEFITSPTVMIGLPYGLKKVKLSDGSKIEIPNSIRQQSSTEIYNMYHSIMEETDQMHLMLSKSTIFRILAICEATERSATTCVDYFIANGMEAFDELHSIVDNWIEQDAVDLDLLKELKVELHETAQYLRADYRLHIKKSSRIADHCATFALSDPNDAKMSLSCSSGDHAHKHDLKCSRCENGEATLNRIKNYAEDLLAETKNIPTNSDSEAQKKVDELVAKYEEQVQLISKYIDQVFEMKKHLLRAAVTNQEREDIINDLEDNHALITIDFAQKYLPRWHREKQSDYFGKKGLSWHVSHVAARIGENYTQHSFIHIYDSEVQQNSELVILTLSHIATELKKVGITTISIRSDNAGAYHCVSTIASLHWLMNDFGITVKSYSFSEAQNGKSSSDRDAARVKQKASRYVSMGNDITTSADFFKAIKSGKQLNGVSIYHGSVAKDLDGKAKWDGISDLNYFTVEDNGIRARKYSGIGEGKFVPTEELVSMNGTYSFEEAGFVASGIGSIESERQAVRDGTQTKFWYYSPKRCTVSNCEEETEETTTTELDETVDSSNDQKKLFLCSHPGCSESFLKASGLEKHLLRGVHKVSPDKLTMNDYSLKMYSRGLEEVNRKRKHSGSIDVIAEAIDDLKEETETVRLSTGWALAKKATRKAFVADVKQFLVECFEEGLNKKRLNPSTIAKRMAAATKADGTKRFTVEQRLDVKQIAGFLSRESRKRRATSLRLRRDEKNAVHVVTEENVEDLEERHWDADWIDYIEDEMTWTEWDEFLTAIAESADPVFDYTNIDTKSV